MEVPLSPKSILAIGNRPITIFLSFVEKSDEMLPQEPFPRGNAQRHLDNALNKISIRREEPKSGASDAAGTAAGRKH